MFISLSLRQQSREALKAYEERIVLRAEVMECYLMTGDADYLLRVAVPDIPALERFILERISPIAQVEKIRSSFALMQGAVQDGVAVACGLSNWAQVRSSRPL